MAGKKDTDKKDTGKSATGAQVPGPDDSQGPKTAESIKTVEELELRYPELVSAVRAEIEIETVGALEICYPKLVSAVRDEVIEQIGKCTLDQVKENMPDFYQRLVIAVQSKGAPDLNVPGFLLELDDPFAAGTLRTYQQLKKTDGLRLPFVLPYKDKVTNATLQNYILRAGGGGDNEKVKAARRAMEKVK